MPISIHMMLACLSVLRGLFFVIAGLLVLLGLKSLIDPELTAGLFKPLVLASAAVGCGLLAGWARRLLARRAGIDP